MPLVLCSLQNGEQVRFEELSDAVHFEGHHVRLHQVAIITGKVPRLLLDQVCFFQHQLEACQRKQPLCSGSFDYCLQQHLAQSSLLSLSSAASVAVAAPCTLLSCLVNAHHVAVNMRGELFFLEPNEETHSTKKTKEKPRLRLSAST